ncbi:DUF2283 domain-containing protein [Candidatus Azambacteria bacterium]|nr:DUF2283 domain-containing protein [Candidatus Azambacteria bacterium]
MKLYYYYDTEADVFYLSKGKPSSQDESQETSDDVIIRQDSRTHKIKGFTILSFTKRSKKKDIAIPLPINIELTTV